ncbi:piggyBac transposable element-derived protein 4-like [Xyrichtys novacula]|uniref:PiggyBac transposable element-derived protein 4-like n=1 Tax=Xyrichtys novacula TaxID=13765 RepID=A0AAV1GC51_XYRNO|nr:piggyBac transposable element-derived protein 4-like [Xyrichtys novacula]
MCLFYHLVDVLCFNAYILFTSVDPSWNSGKNFKRRLFLQQLGRALIAPATANRSHFPRGPFAASLVLQAQGQVHQEEGHEKQGEEEEKEEKPQPGLSRKRKACLLCPNPKRVRSQCIKCRGYACRKNLALVCLQ